MHRQFYHLIIIAIAGCMLSLPLILYGFPAYSHDGWIHALWSANFSRQLWAGELYPRWLAGLNRDLGSPAFFFYPPFPYYLTSIFRLFFSPDAQGWQPLGLSALTAVIAGASCVYLWLSRITDKTAACAATVFYTALPYHLIVDLYIRGALGELFGFVWMPLALYFTLRVEDRPRLAFAGLAVSYALLIFSHLPTALIFAPLPLIYACVRAEPSKRKQNTLLAVLATGLGVGLSAIYLLPAIAMRRFVSIQEMQQGLTHYENWFLFSSFSLRELSAQITVITVISIMLAVCFFAVVGRTQERPFKRESRFWLSVSLLAFFVMTPASRLLWRLLPVLQNIQFPYRFNVILAISTTALFAIAVQSTEEMRARSKSIARFTAVIVLLIFFIATAAYGWRQYKIHNQFVTANNDLVTNNVDAPEYRPRGANRDRLPANKVTVTEGMADVSIVSRQSRRLILNVNAAQATTLDVPQFYFPGWQWRLMGAKDFQDALASPMEGLVRITVPGGRHQVEVQLNATWPERSGQIISALCSGLLLLFCFRRRRS